MQLPNLINSRIFISTIASAAMISLSACGGGGGGGGASADVFPVVTKFGSLTVDWDAPITREGGASLTPATDLSAYRVMLGLVSGEYIEELVIDKATNNSEFTNTMVVIDNIPVEIDNIAVGSYFYVVTAIDNEGRESLYSSELSMAAN